MRIVRASEIGTYQFCKRAWWYQFQGYASENKAELAGGNELHAQHGQQVIAGNCMQVLALTFLLLAILSVVVYFFQLKL